MVIDDSGRVRGPGMLTEDYLALGLVRLTPGQSWVAPGGDLSFLFPRTGAGSLVTGAITRPLSPGDGLMLRGGSDTKLCVGECEFDFWSFSLRVEHLFPLFACEELSLLQNIVDDLKHPRLYPTGSAIAMECQRLLNEIRPAFCLNHRTQLLRVASVILSVEFKRERNGSSGYVGPEEHLIQAMEKLSISEIIELSVDELAARFGCSRRHLNRLFHAHFDMSVGALRMEMRLLKAVSLLRDPGAKVINVAERCGFNHLGLFNSCFKRRFGVNPSQWRKATLASNKRCARMISSDSNCRLRHMGLCPWCGDRSIANQGRCGQSAVPRHPAISRRDQALVWPRSVCLTPRTAARIGTANPG